MGLFSREQRARGTATDPPVGSPGITLASALDLDGCLRALGRTLLGFRAPEYTRLPTLTEASWAWDGEPGQAPATVVICADRAGDYVLVALWPDSGGCRIGLVPLDCGQQTGGQQAGGQQAGGQQAAGQQAAGQQAAGPESSMVTPWRLHDPSLSGPTDDLGAGLIRLVPPVLPPGWVAEIVSAGGFRPTRRNTQMAARAAGRLFLGRAGLFIEHREPRRFLRRHSRRQPVNEAALQEIIDDLARTNPGALPYLQWLPVRTRAVMLEHVQNPDTFWGDLDR
jgi:hypothetical protein